MRRIFTLMVAMALGMAAWAEVPLVYVLNLNDEVDAKMRLITRRALNEAADNDAQLIVIHINTYGGP